MDFERLVRLTNRGMIAFDLALGASAIAVPDATLRFMGHDAPSEDARHLFRRCGPIWLTFAAAHLVAAIRDQPEDWWALVWLRGTEVFTDVLWSASPAFSRAGARERMRSLGAGNVALAAGFAALARRGR